MLPAAGGSPDTVARYPKFGIPVEGRLFPGVSCAIQSPDCTRNTRINTDFEQSAEHLACVIDPPIFQKSVFFRGLAAFCRLLARAPQTTNNIFASSVCAQKQSQTGRHRAGTSLKLPAQLVLLPSHDMRSVLCSRRVLMVLALQRPTNVFSWACTVSFSNAQSSCYFSFYFPILHVIGYAFEQFCGGLSG